MYCANERLYCIIIFNNILHCTVVFDQLSAGDLEVCLGSSETSDYLLVNITSQVNCVLLEHACI